MSEAILVILMLLSIIIIFCMYKIFDKKGFYYLIVIFSILSFIASFKISYILKMNVNTSIVPLSSLISIIYLFVSKYGPGETKDLLKITLYSNIIIAILLGIMNYFDPAITETISINMEGTFQYNYKILIAYPFITVLSTYIIIKLFDIVYKMQTNYIISSIITYIINGILFPIIFYLIVYTNIMNIHDSLFIGVSTYILGLIITIINTLIINTMNKKKVL